MRLADIDLDEFVAALLKQEQRLGADSNSDTVKHLDFKARGDMDKAEAYRETAQRYDIAAEVIQSFRIAFEQCHTIK